MIVNIQGKNYQIQKGTRLMLNSGEEATVKEEFRGTLIVSTPTDDNKVINPFYDILNVIIEEVTASVLKVVVAAIGSFFNKILKKIKP